MQKISDKQSEYNKDGYGEIIPKRLMTFSQRVPIFDGLYFENDGTYDDNNDRNQVN